MKWGGRVRQSLLEDTSRGNFLGTYTFLTLAQYQKTMELEQAGYTGAQIAATRLRTLAIQFELRESNFPGEPDRCRVVF